jgi:uncharacterized protein
VRFIFDAAKNAANLAKHGVSLADAEHLDWDSALLWIDQRGDYGEQSQCALAVLVDSVYFTVFVDRDDSRRVISLRKANEREFDRYVSYLDPADG